MIRKYQVNPAYLNELNTMIKQLETSKYVIEERPRSFYCFTKTARGRIMRFNQSNPSYGGTYRWIIQYTLDQNNDYWYETVRNTKRAIERYFNEALMERLL